MNEKNVELLKNYKTEEELKKAGLDKTLSEEDLENVNGGRSDNTYGESISSGDVDKIAAGTAVIYTDSIDGYKYHHALFVRCYQKRIVLKPADNECKTFFDIMCEYENSNMNEPVDGGTAYEIFYTWSRYNYLYLE